METKAQSYKSRIFKQAHAIRKATGKAFAICLLKAWQAYKLVQKMRQQVVKFAYEKVDGSLRYATGTLTNLSQQIKGTGSGNNYTVAYFDMEAQAFRSFKIENLLTVY